MKTISTTKIIPAREVTETSFQCDVCAFTSKDAREVTKHHAREHSSKAHRNIAGTEFHWFETAEDYRAFHCDQGLATDYEYTLYRFTGPGWYGLRRFGYGDGCEAAFSLEYLKNETLEEIEDKQHFLTGLDSLEKSGAK